MSEPRTPRHWRPSPPLLAFLTSVVTGSVLLAVLSLPDRPLQAAISGAPTAPLAPLTWLVVIPPFLVVVSAQWRDVVRGVGRAVSLLRATVAAAIVLGALPLTTHWLQSEEAIVRVAGIGVPCFTVGFVAAFAREVPRPLAQDSRPASSHAFDDMITGVLGYVGFCLPLAIVALVLFLAPEAPPPSGHLAFRSDAFFGIIVAALIGLFTFGLLLPAPLGGVLGGWLRYGSQRSSNAHHT